MAKAKASGRVARAVEALRQAVIGGDDPAGRLPAVASDPATPAASWRFPCETGDGPPPEPRPGWWGKRSRAEALRAERLARMIGHARARLTPEQRYCLRLGTDGPAALLAEIRSEARRLQGLVALLPARREAAARRGREIEAAARSGPCHPEMVLAAVDPEFGKLRADLAESEGAEYWLNTLRNGFARLFNVAEDEALKQIGDGVYPSRIGELVAELVATTPEGATCRAEWEADHPAGDNAGRPRGPAVRL